VQKLLRTFVNSDNPTAAYKMFKQTLTVEGVKRRGMGYGSPSQPTRGHGERRKLPQPDWLYGLSDNIRFYSAHRLYW